MSFFKFFKDVFIDFSDKKYIESSSHQVPLQKLVLFQKKINKIKLYSKIT